MVDNQNLDAVFSKPTEPKNSWQLLCWIFFEPKLLKRYSNNLNRQQALSIQLKTYPWIILSCSFLYLLACALIVTFDLPLLISKQFEPEVIEVYKDQISTIDKYLVVINSTYLIFIKKLTFSLAWGLAYSLAFSLAWGLTAGLTTGLAWNLAFDLAFDLAMALTFGLVFGLALGLALSLTWGLALGLAGGLVLGLAWDLIFGLVWTLTFIGMFYLSYFRIIFYPFYYKFKMDFHHAPYLHDANIWLPIWRAKKRLCEQAMETPKIAAQFITFLRTYRPLQDKLADNITHAALAGIWFHQPLQLNTLKAPVIETEKLQASNTWLKELTRVNQRLVDYHNQTHISLKKDLFLAFIKRLEQFKRLTEAENKSWREYYLQALNLWQQEANKELQQIEIQLKKEEPITANIYLSGDALTPTNNCQVFLGRNDLQQEFTNKVLTSANMPMFLIQGQRRTGKTSLLNFLEQLIGSGFKVVKQDLQAATFDSIHSWLTDLQQQICIKLDIQPPEPQIDENWLQHWKSLQHWLIEISQDSDYKLILAFDEYEAIHDLLVDDEKQGNRLLAAMRSFSQQQNQVVFLFVGAALFSELENPNWSEYFVQAQRFKVDYLKRPDAQKLIIDPVKLIYPAEVVEQMYQLTQGHPALLQLLCSKMVTIANSDGRKNMCKADLDKIVFDTTHERETLAIYIFWKQFCKEDACKQTVLEILNQQAISHKKQLYRLQEHGFIIEKNGQWQMRVPLFEQWLQYFSERI